MDMRVKEKKIRQAFWRIMNTLNIYSRREDIPDEQKEVFSPMRKSSKRIRSLDS